MGVPAPGHNSEAVIDLINCRAAVRTHSYQDGRRLALIVEGGGMRGVLSAGCLIAFDLLGCRNVFDEIYATSAGGVNCAYFLSGQWELGISMYFNDLSSLRFANPLRFWKILDIDYVYDHLIPKINTLDEAAVRAGRPEFFVGVTDVESGKNLLIDVKRSPHSIIKVLKASAAIPALYNRTIKLGDRRYVDGGLSDLLPIAKAVSRGCTDILVLPTRIRTHFSKQRPLWERLAFLMMMGCIYPEVYRAFCTSPQRTSLSRAYAMGRQVIEGTNIATICPTSEESIVSRTTRSRPILIEGTRRMAIRTANILGRPVSKIEQAFAQLERKSQ